MCFLRKSLTFSYTFCKTCKCILVGSQAKNHLTDEETKNHEVRRTVLKVVFHIIRLTNNIFEGIICVFCPEKNYCSRIYWIGLVQTSQLYSVAEGAGGVVSCVIPECSEKLCSIFALRKHAALNHSLYIEFRPPKNDTFATCDKGNNNNNNKFWVWARNCKIFFKKCKYEISFFKGFFNIKYNSSTDISMNLKTWNSQISQSIVWWTWAARMQAVHTTRCCWTRHSTCPLDSSKRSFCPKVAQRPLLHPLSRPFLALLSLRKLLTLLRLRGKICLLGKHCKCGLWTIRSSIIVIVYNSPLFLEETTSLLLFEFLFSCHKHFDANDFRSSARFRVIFIIVII